VQCQIYAAFACTVGCATSYGHATSLFGVQQSLGVTDITIQGGVCTVLAPAVRLGYIAVSAKQGQLS